jgi:hypothetical protein
MGLCLVLAGWKQHESNDMVIQTTGAGIQIIFRQMAT